MTTWFFALYTFLVMILAGPVHQESLAGPLMGLLRGPTAARKIIRDRRKGGENREGWCPKEGSHMSQQSLLGSYLYSQNSYLYSQIAI